MAKSHAIAFLLALTIASACDRPKEKAEPLETARRLTCLPLWPIHLALEGTLGTEPHLGPPGYGETPAQDRRDTIVVLRLNKSVKVCGGADTTAVTVSKIQIGGYAGPMTPGIGSRVTVFGTLRPAVFGWHYLPIVMTVDSIPALRAGPRRVG